MPPPNTPEEGLRLPAPQQAYPDVVRAPSPHTSSAMANASADEAFLLEVDYQSIEYVEPVDDTLLCPVCKTPFYSPITTPCGHTFCAGCINRALETQQICPIDRQPINKTQDYHRLPLIIKDQLDRLKVKCPNKGCDHVCSREHLEGHYERHCDFRLVRCPDPSCGGLIPHVHATSENGCMHRNTACDYCHKVMSLEEIYEHHESDCEGAVTTCEECNTGVVRHHLARHLADDCPEGQARCRWQAAGCKVTDKRRIVQEHEKSGCLFETISMLLDERAAHHQTIVDLTGRIKRLEVSQNRRRERRNESAPAQEGVVSPATPTSAVPITVPELMLNGTATDVGAWGSPEDYMLAQFERLETQMEELRKQMREIDSRQSLIFLQHTTHVNEQLADLASKVGVINMHTTWLLNMQRQSNAQQRAGSTPGPSSSGISHGTDSSGTRSGSSTESAGRYQGATRRNSDGRGETLTRL